MDKSIPFVHIKSIVNIFLEEMFRDLQEGKKIVIGNFGKLFVRQISPQRFINIYTNRHEIAEIKQIVRFELIKDLRVMLINGLDIAKTFGDA